MNVKELNELPIGSRVEIREEGYGVTGEIIYGDMIVCVKEDEDTWWPILVDGRPTYLSSLDIDGATLVS